MNQSKKSGNITWQLHPLLSSDSIVLALRSVRRARFEAVLVVVAVGLLHVDATVPEHVVSVSPRRRRQCGILKYLKHVIYEY